MINDSNRRWWVLVGTCAGLFLLMLDSTIVTLALPTIQHDLHSSNTELQWIVNAYLLTLAVLVVTAGRLGDMFGRRTVFLIGMVVFGLGAVVSAAAPTMELLIAGRVLQGAGGSALLVLSLAICANAFPPEERPRALGIWAGISALALAIGPLVGGTLIESVGWRMIFWIDLPIVVAGIAVILAAAVNERDPTGGDTIDWPGLISFSLGTVCLILPLVEGQQWGWGSPATIGLLCASVVLLFAFWRIEHRVENPIVDFSLFRSRPYLGASGAAFAILTCYWVVAFYQPQFLQNVLDYSPIEAGLLILPLTAPMIVVSPLAGRLTARVGARTLMTFGLALVVVSMLLLTRIDSTTGYAQLLPAYLIFGLALGFVYAPMQTAAMLALPPEKAGIASGVLAMDRMVSGALGLAATGALFAHLTSQQLDQQLNAPKAAAEAGERGELDGLLAGSDSAREALGGLPPGLVHSIEQTVRDVYSYAIARSSWILVGIATAGMIVTWIYVRSPEQAAAEAAERDPARDPASHHHRRLHF